MAREDVQRSQQFHPVVIRDPNSGRRPDDDRFYRQPRAWFHAKRAFGVKPGEPRSGGEPGRALVALETFAPGCPRTALAVAVHLFLSVPREVQRAAESAYGAAEDASLRTAMEAARKKGKVDHGT